MTRYFAFEGGVMTAPDVTVEISAEQYAKAIAGLTEGRTVTISDGFVVIEQAALEIVAQATTEEG